MLLNLTENDFFLREAFFGPENAFAAGALPRTPLGELTTLPRLPSRLGRGPLPRPHPMHPCLRRSGLPPYTISGYATTKTINFSRRQTARVCVYLVTLV